MNRRIAVATVVGFAASGAVQVSAAAEVDPIGQWNIVALEATRGQGPLMQVRALALVHAAIFDAANGVDRRFAPYLVDLKAGGAVSAAAAVGSAAHTVLSSLAPERRGAFDAALVASLASVPAGVQREQSVAFGRRVAEAVLARRKQDGASATRDYRPAAAAGVWRPTPPGNQPPLGAHWGEVQPFLIGESARFAPPAPPAPNSERYTRDFAEVKVIGARNSARRSPDQTVAAVFWTAFSSPIWSSAARQALARQPDLSLVQRARVFALLSGAMADASVVAWAAKFKHGLWRPVTAIRLAASDGNDATEADAAWEPIIPTPPFPCYVSGHATLAGAAERALALALGSDRFDLEITNPELGLTRRYASFSELAREAHEVRIWSGVHFRVSQEEGLAAGRRIAEASAATRLLPIASPSRASAEVVPLQQ